MDEERNESQGIIQPSYITSNLLLVASLLFSPITSSLFAIPFAHRSPAPDRNDVLWSNLERTIRRRFVKSLISISVAVVLTLVVAAVCYTISVQISANNIKEAWNPLSEVADIVPYGEEVRLNEE